jgi:hypothetical protein
MDFILGILGWIVGAVILFAVAAWFVQFELIGAILFGALFGLVYVAMLD